MMKKRVGHTRDEHGQSLVEFAFMLPILILVLAAAVDLGRAYYTYVAITNAAREGARFGASNPSNTSGVRDRVRNEIQGTSLSIPDGQIPSPACYLYVEGSTDYGSGVSCSSASSGDYIQVQVNYPFYFITGYVLGLGSVTMSQSATMAISR
jgi:Flp pilus assembly protein TadG